MNWWIYNINKALESSGLSAAEASRRATGNAGFIKDMRLGREPGIDRYIKLCRVLGIKYSFDLSEEYSKSSGLGNAIPHNQTSFDESQEEVPHYGDIAAGGSMHPDDQRIYWAADYWEGEMTKAPAGLKGEELSRYGGLIGLTVRGDSMAPIYNDGDIIYVYGQDPLMYHPEEAIGKACAITLTEEYDNAVYLKRLRWPDNQKKGYFNLESLNPIFPTMVNTPVRSILPIRFIRVIL